MVPYKFELAGYCEGCPYFCTELESIDISTLENPEPRTLYTIRCKNRGICARAIRAVNQVTIDDKE